MTSGWSRSIASSSRWKRGSPAAYVSLTARSTSPAEPEGIALLVTTAGWQPVGFAHACVMPTRRALCPSAVTMSVAAGSKETTRTFLWRCGTCWQSGSQGFASLAGFGGLVPVHLLRIAPGCCMLLHELFDL